MLYIINYSYEDKNIHRGCYLIFIQNPKPIVYINSKSFFRRFNVYSVYVLNCNTNLKKNLGKITKDNITRLIKDPSVVKNFGTPMKLTYDETNFGGDVEDVVFEDLHHQFLSGIGKNSKRIYWSMREL